MVTPAKIHLQAQLPGFGRAMFFLGLFCTFGLLSARAAEKNGQHALAHAHNDYQHPRPLLDALALGYDSVEADVHLVQGRLLVAHDRAQARPDRTLESLYLDPLSERVGKNRGWLGAPGRSLILLVDVKSEAEPTLAALHALLTRYAGMLTSFESGAPKLRAITVIVSGNRIPALIEAQSPRYASLDGGIDDRNADAPPSEVMPLVSGDWRKYFQWLGEGLQPAEESARLAQIVAEAHAHGRRLRFWNTPDRVELWQVLHEAGVDLIGTDDLPKLRQFLDSK